MLRFMASLTEEIVGDSFELANQINGDVIVTSPSWGGPEYTKM